MNKKQKRRIILSLTILTVIVAQSTLFSWESYDRVIAVVNSKPIVESEVMEKLYKINKGKAIPTRKMALKKSKILDSFIENSLVLETAQDKSIIITDEKVFNHLEKLMKQFYAARIKNEEELDELIPEISSRLKWQLKGDEIDDWEEPSKNPQLDKKLKQFTNFLEKQQKTPIADLFENIRIQMRREQVMSIAIGVSPPSKKEAKKWYKKNKKKMGYEVRVKQILFRVGKKSLTEQSKIHKKLSQIRARALKGESFEKLARQFSQDRGSAKNGGDLGWKMLPELDGYMAGYIHNNMKKKGQISIIIKNKPGTAYFIVKYMGKRSVPYEKMERMIMYRLYTENMASQFKKWVARRKRMSEIIILMENYRKG
ncbi:MAG: hypothetical protein GY754_06705 [bacterium]|nr:hypothetical protein [bacterium]